MTIYSVSQITKYLKESLQKDSSLRDLWINGEISNLSISSAGHAYFTLKDNSGSIRCVMFKPALGSEQMQKGSAILAHGRISIYEARGDVQLYVDIVQPEGVGELHLKLEQLKLKLKNEGLFEPSRKRRIPIYPKKIAVVTSPTGAVYHDIHNIIERRYPLTELVLVPTLVQGEEAPIQIVNALQAINDDGQSDVIIIARGGGAPEELMAFNDETVAYAIFRSSIPIISAIGHETDITIADLVADIRAPTPSVAAELAVPNKTQLILNISDLTETSFSALLRKISQHYTELHMVNTQLVNNLPEIEDLRIQIDELLQTAITKSNSDIDLRKERLKAITNQLSALNPSSVLSRGYAIVQDNFSKAIITTKKDAPDGAKIMVTVNDGNFRAKVISKL